MIDLDYTFGNAQINCDEDGCKTEEEMDGFDGHVSFEMIIEQMKEEGWSIGKKHGDWHHICPSCVQEGMTGQVDPLDL